ncbi:MAG: hypothetical protein IPM96_12965 [Ignavibacteria bacterium]|nr:hypothetical protein [Ignavibacteria bacterium]
MRKYLILIKFLILSQISFAQPTTIIPQYTLVAKNFNQVNTYQMTFDLIFTKTDSIPLELSAWGFIFRIPVGIGTLGFLTGENSSFVYDSSGGDAISDLSVGLRPRNPSVANSGGTHYELRTITFTIGTGGGFLLPQGVPLLIGRFKLKSTTPINVSALIPDKFIIRDSCESPLPAARTRVIFYNENSFSQEITRCSSHSVDISGIYPIIVINLKLASEGLYDPVSDVGLRKDIVTAFLRNASPPYLIIDSSRSVIDSISHTGIFNFLNRPTGTYYLSVDNEKILETWSENGGTVFINGSNNYDFTLWASKAYGDNLVLKGGRYCFYTGDVNNDQIIDSEDLAMVENDVFIYTTGDVITNLNGDNIVDIDDLAIADRNAENLVMTERPGQTLQKRNNLLKKNQFVKK